MYIINYISNIDFKTDCSDVNIVVDNYDAALTSPLDSDVPLQTNNVTCRDLHVMYYGIYIDNDNDNDNDFFYFDINKQR